GSPNTPGPNRGGPAARRTPSPSRGLDMDLSNLTRSGWGLLISTFGFILGQAICLVLWVPDAEKLMDDRRWRVLLPLAGLGLAVGFFLLGKFVLARLGFPIYRQE